jgi:hypothetical protein
MSGTTIRFQRTCVFVAVLVALICVVGAGCADNDHHRVGAPQFVAFPSLRSLPPIPRRAAEELGVLDFVGQSTTDSPLAPLMTANHPLLPMGDARIHNDHYNSGVYNRPGPRGNVPSVTSARLTAEGDLANICAMLTFDENGYVIGACIQAMLSTFSAATWLVMFDPVTLDIVAETLVAPRPLIQNSSGGGYFTYDREGRIFIGPANNHVEIWRVEIKGGRPQFVMQESFDVSGALPDDALLQDTVLDWDGRLWFVATTGEVGYIDTETGDSEMLATGEGLQNSMVVDESGVYVLTFEALYKFSVDGDGSIAAEWRAAYDPGSGAQGLDPGSGTTPTLLGSEDDLITIADNADTQINLLVLDRATGAEICKVPLFRPGESAAENSAVGYGDEIVVPNNGGFGGPLSRAFTTNPGLEKHRVRPDRSGCDLVWANDTTFGNSAQLSTRTGLIYGYGPDPDVPQDAFYFTAVDWETGEEVFRLYTGNGRAFNPVLGQPHLHPDGYAFIGTLHGIVRIADE